MLADTEAGRDFGSLLYWDAHALRGLQRPFFLKPPNAYPTDGHTPTLALQQTDG